MRASTNRFQPLYMDYSSEEETRDSTTPPFPPTPITATEAAYVHALDAKRTHPDVPQQRFQNLTITDGSSQTKTSDPRKFPSFKSYKPIKILSSNSNTDFPSLSGLAATLPSNDEPKVRWKESFAKKVDDLRMKEEIENQRLKEEAESQRKQNLFLMNTLAPRFRRRIEDIMQEESAEDHHNDEDNVSYYPEEDTFVPEPEDAYDDTPQDTEDE